MKYRKKLDAIEAAYWDGENMTPDLAKILKKYNWSEDRGLTETIPIVHHNRCFWLCPEQWVVVDCCGVPQIMCDIDFRARYEPLEHKA